jgi:hypothetical protein
MMMMSKRQLLFQYVLTNKEGKFMLMTWRMCAKLVSKLPPEDTSFKASLFMPMECKVQLQDTILLIASKICNKIE